MADKVETRPDTRRTQAQANGRPSSERQPGASPDIGRDMADTRTDARRTHRGQSCKRKADTWRTHGGQGLEAWTKRTQAGHKARGGHMAGKREADTRPTSSGDAAGLCFLRENTSVNGLGNKERTQGGQVADKDRRSNKTRRTSGGHKADTWRTSSGDVAKATNTRRTRTGGAAKPDNT